MLGRTENTRGDVTPATPAMLLLAFCECANSIYSKGGAGVYTCTYVLYVHTNIRYGKNNGSDFLFPVLIVNFEGRKEFLSLLVQKLAAIMVKRIVGGFDKDY